MSSFHPPFLVAFTVDLPKQNRSLGKLPGMLFSDVMLIVGIGIGLVLVLALGIYAWRQLSRKRRRHVSSGEKVFRGAPAQEEPTEDAEAQGEEDEPRPGRRRYKYRVRRRGHRSRNPTLSETGGLPPVKTQEPSKPF